MQATVDHHDHNGTYMRNGECEAYREGIKRDFENVHFRLGDVKCSVDGLKEDFMKTREALAGLVQASKSDRWWLAFVLGGVTIAVNVVLKLAVK